MQLCSERVTTPKLETPISMKTLIISFILLCFSFGNALFAQIHVAVSDSINIDSFEPIDIDVLANDSLGDDPFTVVLLTQPYEGSAYVNEDNSIAYMPYEPENEIPPCTCIDIFTYGLCSDYDCTEIYAAADIWVYWSADAEMDYVWPGDTNDDGIANALDLLSIGQHFGVDGPSRYLDFGIEWVEHHGLDWQYSNNEGVNLKHVDCNGDGVIDQHDVEAIEVNYGLEHNKTANTEQTNFEASLYIDIVNEVVGESDTVEAIIRLGDDFASLEEAYGLAFSINYNQALIEPNTVSIAFTDSWLSTGSPILEIYKELDGRTETAISRTDHASVGGSGVIGAMTFVMEDVLIGKDQSAALQLMPSDVRLVTAENNVVEIEPVGDEVTVVGIESKIMANNEFEIWPNPIEDHFQLRFEQPVELKEVALYNSAGIQVWIAEPGFTGQLFDLKPGKLASGNYILRGVSSLGIFHQNAVILD